MLWAILLALAIGPQPSTLEGSPARRLAGFDPLVIAHVNRVMGTEHLPAGRGQAITPGVLVVLAQDRMQIFDRDVATLQGGRVVEGAIAAKCHSGCPVVFHDAFQVQWLTMAIEAASLGIGVSSRVLFAAHADVPVKTLLQAAYAAAETRPISPPSLSLLVNSAGRGLQAIDFHLLPPEGLELRRGAGAALGLTIELGQGRYVISANDPGFITPREVQSLAAVRSITRAIKKKYPGKQTVVLVPDETVTMRELVELGTQLREEFPRLVLSQGQPLVLP